MRFDIQPDVLVHVDVDLAKIIGQVVSQDNSWYRTPSLQRHAQRVCPRFSAEEILEFVGIAALANAVCGLSAVTNDR